jgi:hypothetical protein
MSYGTDKRYASKKALREDVEARGADRVGVFGTSIFGNETATTVAELAGTFEVIVGPDVYTDRRWYANVKVKKDGTIYVA